MGTQVYRKIHACALELLTKLGHSYVISTLSREPLFSISEDREVVCKEGVLLECLTISSLCDGFGCIRLHAHIYACFEVKPALCIFAMASLQLMEDLEQPKRLSMLLMLSYSGNVLLQMRGSQN